MRYQLLNVLTIAGSDPSSGAGIQGDIKTFSALGCYGFTVVTTITCQNTSKFFRVSPVSHNILEAQIDAVLSDFTVHAIKVGMVYNSMIIKLIHKKIARLEIPIIVDPVIRSTTGGILLQRKAIDDFKKYMIPISTVITPNVYELEKLSGCRIKNKNDIIYATNVLKNLGAKNIIVTGVDEGKQLSDHVFFEEREFVMSGKKLSIHNHGGGCTYSAALTASLAKRNSLFQSVYIAKKFTFDSIKNSLKIGKKLYITQNKTQDKNKLELNKSIEDFVLQKRIWQYIPECQTNFVFAKKNPRSTRDILGLDGRIIRAGNRVIATGDIIFGGSKHVAAAVLQMNKKFSNIRAGINIKYDKKIVEKIRKQGLKIAYYDRSKEPKSIKNKENSTISWGIKNILKNATEPYDAIYHTGDFGKESMIIIFGEIPSDVVKKISLIV